MPNLPTVLAGPINNSIGWESLEMENPPLPLAVQQFVRMLRVQNQDDLHERSARLIEAQAIEIALLRAALQRENADLVAGE
jgi:hypothetical protein